MSNKHYKEVCKLCDDIINQCRCFSKDKEIVYKICNKCKNNKTAKKSEHPKPRFFPEDGFIRKNFDYGDSPYFGTPGNGEKSMKDYILKRRKRNKKSLLDKSILFLKIANEVSQLSTDLKTVTAVINSLMNSVGMQGQVSILEDFNNQGYFIVTIKTNYSKIDAHKFYSILKSAASSGKAGPDAQRVLGFCRLEIISKDGPVSETSEEKTDLNSKLVRILIDIMSKIMIKNQSFKELLTSPIRVDVKDNAAEGNKTIIASFSSSLTEEKDVDFINKKIISVLKTSASSGNEFFKNKQVSLIHYFNNKNNNLRSTDIL